MSVNSQWCNGRVEEGHSGRPYFQLPQQNMGGIEPPGDFKMLWAVTAIIGPNKNMFISAGQNHRQLCPHQLLQLSIYNMI